MQHIKLNYLSQLSALDPHAVLLLPAHTHDFLWTEKNLENNFMDIWYYSKENTDPIQVSAIPVQAATPAPHIQPPL